MTVNCPYCNEPYASNAEVERIRSAAPVQWCSTCGTLRTVGGWITPKIASFVEGVERVLSRQEQRSLLDRIFNMSESIRSKDIS